MEVAAANVNMLMNNFEVQYFACLTTTNISASLAKSWFLDLKLRPDFLLIESGRF